MPLSQVRQCCTHGCARVSRAAQREALRSDPAHSEGARGKARVAVGGSACPAPSAPCAPEGRDEKGGKAPCHIPPWSNSFVPAPISSCISMTTVAQGASSFFALSIGGTLRPRSQDGWLIPAHQAGTARYRTKLEGCGHGDSSALRRLEGNGRPSTRPSPRPSAQPRTEGGPRETPRRSASAGTVRMRGAARFGRREGREGRGCAARGHSGPARCGNAPPPRPPRWSPGWSRGLSCECRERAAPRASVRPSVRPSWGFPRRGAAGGKRPLSASRARRCGRRWGGGGRELCGAAASFRFGRASSRRVPPPKVMRSAASVRGLSLSEVEGVARSWRRRRGGPRSSPQRVRAGPSGRERSAVAVRGERRS